MLIFGFPEKDQRLVCPPYFVYNFSRKNFNILYSIDDQIDVMKIEIKLIFIIKPFCYMTKKNTKKI